MNTKDANALLNENSNVVTDLSKLGKAGTKFTHDFFLSATLISFPQDAVSAVAKRSMLGIGRPRAASEGRVSNDPDDGNLVALQGLEPRTCGL